MPDTPITPPMPRREDAESRPEPASKQDQAFEPITSQTQLDKLLGDRLARERAKYADYDDVKAKATQWDKAEEANRSDLDKAVARADKAESDLAKLTQANLRLEVAHAKGLPPELAKRLSGTSREEMEADADALSALLAPPSKAPRPSMAQNGADTAPETDFLRAAFQR